MGYKKEAQHSDPLEGPGGSIQKTRKISNWRLG